MKITIKTLKGETFPVEVEPTTTVLELKNKIKDLKNFDVDTQKIVFKGKGTSNTDELQKIGVKDNDFLVIMTMVKKPEPKKVEQKQEDQKQVKEQKQQQDKPKKEEKPAKLNQLELGPQEFEAKVTNLLAMGFARQKCEESLRAAYGNEDRAVDYLLNGIPSNPLQSMQGGPDMGSSMLGAVLNNPQFAQIRDMIRNDPSSLQPVLEQLAQSSPELYQLIAQHPEDFERLIMEGEEDEQFQGQEGQAPPGSILVSEQEEAAINRLVALGFPKIEAAQAYMACQKNQQLAANLLFDRLANGDFDDNGDLPEGGEGDGDDDDNLFN